MTGQLQDRVGDSERMCQDMEQTIEMLKNRILEERAEFDRERAAMDRDYTSFKKFHEQFKHTLAEKQRLELQKQNIQSELGTRNGVLEQQARLLQGEVAMKNEHMERLVKQIQGLRDEARGIQAKFERHQDVISELKKSKQLIIATCAEETQRLKDANLTLQDRLRSRFKFPWSR